MSVRGIEVLRGAWGASMLSVPRVVLEQVHHLRVDPRSLAVARVLGARHLAQATLSGVDPSAEVLAMGVWVDCAHAATAVGLAVLDRSRARAGLTDAVVAACWAGFGLRDLRSTRSRHAQDKRRDALARLVLRWVPGGSLLLQMAQG